MHGQHQIQYHMMRVQVKRKKVYIQQELKVGHAGEYHAGKYHAVKYHAVKFQLTWHPLANQATVQEVVMMQECSVFGR